VGQLAPEKQQVDSTNALNSYAAATDSVPVKPLIKLDFPTEGNPLQRVDCVSRVLCSREEGLDAHMNPILAIPLER
jgi:hypothetical protein